MINTKSSIDNISGCEKTDDCKCIDCVKAELNAHLKYETPGTQIAYVIITISKATVDAGEGYLNCSSNVNKPIAAGLMKTARIELLKACESPDNGGDAA